MRSYLQLLLIVLLFNNCNPKKAADASVLNLIPENAAVLISVNELALLQDEITENAILSSIKKENFAAAITQKLKPLSYVKGETSGLLALSTPTLQRFDFTFIVTDSISGFALDTVKNKEVEILNYQDYILSKYTIEEMTFYTAKVKGMEVMSSSRSTLENSIKNVTKPIFSSTLKKLYTISNSKTRNHIFINLNEANTLISQLFKTPDDALNLLNYADWISLDINLQDNGILLNGISVVKDTTNYLSLFSGTKPRSSITAALVPKEASVFTAYTITDYSVFDRNRKKYLNKNVLKDSLLNTVEEIGLATVNNEQVVLLQTFGTATLRDYLTSITSSAIEYQGSEISKIQGTNFLSDNLHPIVTGFTPNYTSIIENTFVFSAKEETLKKVISDHKTAKAFESTVFYKNTQQITTAASSKLTIASSTGFQKLLNEYSLKELARFLEKTDLKDYVFGSQIVADNTFFHTSYFAKQVSKAQSNSGIASLFSFKTDAAIATDPQFVKNHRTNRQEIVVQDQDHVLYLISNKGKLIWKKQLESRIQGKIHQVDIYKNGKLQLAFTTNDTFLILDRNGKEVAPFTITHEGGNLNPLAVFDYDGKKDYRFLVTQGSKIFMYNTKGKIVKGFKYKKAQSPIIAAPQHFRIRKKDYLCFKLANGQLQILNRVGDVRVKVSEKIDFSENDIKLYKNKFSLTTTKGILYQINTSGKIEKTNLGLNADHGMDATSKTLALINDNILRIRDKKVALDLGVYTRPSIFYLNDKIYVSVTDIQNQKSYLFDSQAKAIADFPIYGSSVTDMADIDNDKRPELVIKDQDNAITVYKIR